MKFAGYAQSPQALVFDDYVRVYFASRTVDERGKFISHIRYADFSLDFSQILDHSHHVVVPPANRGCFDEHGIFPMNVRRVGDKVFGYTNGWSRRTSVSVETGIGLLVSTDQGRTFERLGDGPILSASLGEPVLVGDPFVTHVDGGLHMWYIFGESWRLDSSGGQPERVYKIADAHSKDGIEWTKYNRRLITDRLGADECQALPSVSHFDGAHHMFFSYRQAFDFRRNSANAYRIGYARSTDLQSWARDDGATGLEPSAEGWDSEMMCYPHVFQVREKVHLLYNGNEFGRHGFGLAVLE